MNLIKLDAIDSTNDFLKRLIKNDSIQNWTVVTAESQTLGKGQMGAKWISENGKNLTMSILVSNFQLDSLQLFTLNATVAFSIFKVLQELEIPNLSIKWPNDIMSDHKKIGGILIENTFKSNQQIESVVGIGLNINQKDFEFLPKASSLSIIKNKDFDKNLILKLIYDQLQLQFVKIKNLETENIWANYNLNLFKKGIPMPFEKANGNRFMAIIQEVNQNGKLILKLEDDSFESFEVKELQMLY